MLVYLFYLLVAAFFWMFIRLEGYKVVGAQISYRYQRWRRLNNLVSTQHTTTISIFYHSLCLLCRVLYLSFIQYMNSTIVKLGRNKFLVTYVVSGKHYCIVVKPLRGPTPVLQIIDDKEEDVTASILPYLGPRYDWHGNNINFSETFKSENLTFNLSSGEVVNGKESKDLDLLKK